MTRTDLTTEINAAADALAIARGIDKEAARMALRLEMAAIAEAMGWASPLATVRYDRAVRAERMSA